MLELLRLLSDAGLLFGCLFVSVCYLQDLAKYAGGKDPETPVFAMFLVSGMWSLLYFTFLVETL